MLVLVILAVVWAAVIGSWFVGNRRAGRPDNSVASFRAQLSTLERATPGTSLRPAPVVGLSSRTGSSQAAPSRRSRVLRSRRPSPPPMSRADVRHRRRVVLIGLLASTGITLMLWLAVGGAAFMVLFVASLVGLGTYVVALRQLKLRSLERAAKVRTLVPRTAVAPPLALRRTASD